MKTACFHRHTCVHKLKYYFWHFLHFTCWVAGVQVTFYTQGYQFECMAGARSGVSTVPSTMQHSVIACIICTWTMHSRLKKNITKNHVIMLSVHSYGAALLAAQGCM